MPARIPETGLLAFWWTAGIRTLGIGQHGGTTFTRGVQGLSDIYRGKRGYKRPKSPQKLICTPACTPAYVWLSMSAPVSPCCVKARFPNEKGPEVYVPGGLCFNEVVGFESSYVEPLFFQKEPTKEPTKRKVPPSSTCQLWPVQCSKHVRKCWSWPRSSKAMPKPGGTPQQRLEGAGPGAPAHPCRTAFAAQPALHSSWLE